MATETPQLTQIEPSEARRAEPRSGALVARAWQEKLAGEGSPATPLLQLAVAAGTVLVIAGGALLGRWNLVPPPPSTRVQALTAVQPMRPPPAPLEAAPAAAPDAPAAAAAPTPPAALAAAAPAGPAARRVETAPKSRGKKPHRAPTSTRKRASARPAGPAAPAATRPRRSAS